MEKYADHVPQEGRVESNIGDVGQDILEKNWDTMSQERLKIGTEASLEGS